MLDSFSIRFPPVKIFQVQGADQEGEAIARDQCTFIRTLYRQGWTIKGMSRELDLARNTIRRALKQSCTRTRTRRAPTVLTPFLTTLLERAPQVYWNAARLFRELRELGYSGSYDQVVRAVRPLKAAARLEGAAAVRCETAPGQQARVDWGSTWVFFGTARVRVYLFVMTLHDSRRFMVEATLDDTLATFLACHEHVFKWLGGPPKEILYDHPKAIMMAEHETNGRMFRWNPILLDFLDHYGVVPKICSLGDTRIVAKGESGVKYVKRNFLPDRVFNGLADLNQALRTWVTTVADCQHGKNTHQRPIDPKWEHLREFCHLG